MYNITALLCGILFGCGLTISNMIDANKILNFLDITGNWDPSLALVMLSAVIVTWIGYKFVIKQNRPKLITAFVLPTKKNIDAKLIFGAALFGIGWGLAGYCPGPAITALGLKLTDAFYFFIGMISSILLLGVFSLVYKK
ncbi:MAG: YeeE/YedE thiosulfate transporter family protein [Gammaproteobacteria bacterium]|nr:YeeE/YedE thiosulfate transporter family protein [Gammaproteobacteria bacterium]